MGGSCRVLLASREKAPWLVLTQMNSEGVRGDIRVLPTPNYDLLNMLR
jgi:hypothetical protein